MVCWAKTVKIDKLDPLIGALGWSSLVIQAIGTVGILVWELKLPLNEATKLHIP